MERNPNDPLDQFLGSFFKPWKIRDALMEGELDALVEEIRVALDLENFTNWEFPTSFLGQQDLGTPRFVVGGSFGKRTYVRGTQPDIDFVIQFEHTRDELYSLNILEANFKALSDKMDELMKAKFGERIIEAKKCTKVNKYKISRGTREVEVDLLFVFDVRPWELWMANPSSRISLQAGLNCYQIEFVQRHAQNYLEIISKAKEWRDAISGSIKDMCQEGKTKKDNGWDRGYKPISWMIELLVIWAAEHSEIKDDLKIFLNFLTTIEMVADRTLYIYWTDNYDKSLIATELLSPNRPVIVDPANPTNNVANEMHRTRAWESFKILATRTKEKILHLLQVDLPKLILPNATQLAQNNLSEQDKGAIKEWRNKLDIIYQKLSHLHIRSNDVKTSIAKIERSLHLSKIPDKLVAYRVGEMKLYATLLESALESTQSNLKVAPRSHRNVSLAVVRKIEDYGTDDSKNYVNARVYWMIGEDLLSYGAVHAAIKRFAAALQLYPEGVCPSADFSGRQDALLLVFGELHSMLITESFAAGLDALQACSVYSTLLDFLPKATQETGMKALQEKYEQSCIREIARLQFKLKQYQAARQTLAEMDDDISKMTLECEIGVAIANQLMEDLSNLNSLAEAYVQLRHCAVVSARLIEISPCWSPNWGTLAKGFTMCLWRLFTLDDKIFKKLDNAKVLFECFARSRAWFRTMHQRYQIFWVNVEEANFPDILKGPFTPIENFIPIVEIECFKELL